MEHQFVEKTLSRILSMIICCAEDCGGGGGLSPKGWRAPHSVPASAGAVKLVWHCGGEADKCLDPDWLWSQCGNIVGQAAAGIRGRNHEEDHEGGEEEEGPLLVSAPSKAVDVGLLRTPTSFAYESAGVDLYH